MSVDNAVKGLAVLTAIPVVMLAIWADYFGRALEQLAKENPHYDRTAEHQKIRLAGLCAVFFQFGIFMGSGPVRKEAPIAANILFVVGILLQSGIQGALERRIRKPTPRLRPVENPSASSEEGPGQEIDFALRAFFWAALGGTLYLAGFALPVVVVSFIAKFFHASPSVLTMAVITSAITGMIGGVAVNFALGAFYLRRMLPAREIEEGDLRKGIESCFGRAGIPLPSLWVIETGRSREATAMLAGFPAGRGLFKPGLFLSRGLLDALNEQEIQAVVLHEVSHLKLRHLTRRLLYSVSLVLGTTTAATFCVFLASVLIPSNELRGFVGLGAAAAAFLITFGKLGKQSRAHELEADCYSVEKLGATLDELVSALRKLDSVNGRRPLNPLKLTGAEAHPSTERRIASLHERFGTGQQSASERGKRAA